MNNMNTPITGMEAYNVLRARLQDSRPNSQLTWAEQVGAGHSVLVLDQRRYAQWNVEQWERPLTSLAHYSHSFVGVRFVPGNRTNPHEIVEAESFNYSHYMYAVIRPETNTIRMGDAQPGDYLRFDNLNFTQSASRIRIRYSSASGGHISFHASSVNNPPVASASLAATGGWDSYGEVTLNLSGTVQGPVQLFIKMQYIDLDWFRFEQGDVTPPSVSIVAPSHLALTNSNTIRFEVNASDSGSGVREVAFYYFNGSSYQLLGNDTNAPYQFDVNLAAYGDGNLVFAVRAADHANNWSGYLTREIIVDRTPPTGFMAEPVVGSSISAKRITVRAQVSDATSGVQCVKYYAWSPEPWSNQQWVYIGTSCNSPYAITWSIAHVNWYAYVSALIVDRAGNEHFISGNGNWTHFYADLNTDTIGIFRPSNHTFYLRNQNTTGYAHITAAFGISNDLPVVGDWDGDGVDTIGVYRTSTGQFFLKNANSAGAPIVYQFPLGIPGDVPISGDWDGDGRDSVGVFRPSNGLIYLRNSLTAGFADFSMVFGIPNDRPVTGDWNGDGRDSIGVHRNNTFYLTNTTCNCAPSAHYQFNLGLAGDIPFAGDWDADGFDGVGVFRPTNGITYFKNALTSGYADIGIIYGVAGDVPIAGVWTLTGGQSSGTNITLQPPQQPEGAPTAEQPEVAPTFVPRN
jgi:hypothetical protein